MRLTDVALPIAIALTSGPFILTAKSASACVAPPCDRARLAPPDQAIVPADAPGLVVHEPGGGLPFEFSFTLAGDAAPIAHQMVAIEGTFYKLLRPSQPLQEGKRYELKVSHACGAAAPVKLSHTFTVGPAAAAASDAGVLVTTDVKGIEGSDSPEAGDCSAVFRRAFADLRFDSSDALRPHLPLARLLVMVDGKPFSERAFGYLEATSTVRVFAYCDQSARTTAEALTPGEHEVVAVVETAGRGRVATAPVKVLLSCEAKPAVGGAAGTGATGGSMGASSGGCSFAGAPVQGSFGLALVSILALIFGWRRRPSVRGPHVVSIMTVGLACMLAVACSEKNGPGGTGGAVQGGSIAGGTQEGGQTGTHPDAAILDGSTGAQSDAAVAPERVCKKPGERWGCFLSMATNRPKDAFTCLCECAPIERKRVSCDPVEYACCAYSEEGTQQCSCSNQANLTALGWSCERYIEGRTQVTRCP